MGYTNEELQQLSSKELKTISTSDMIDHPPVRNLGFPPYVVYACKFCGKKIEGSERKVKDIQKAKDVVCPYCKNILWSKTDKNILRKTAFAIGHFETQRKKLYLKFLIQKAESKEVSSCR